MNIKKIHNQIVVTDFELNEDEFPSNLHTVGLELIELNEEKAVFDIATNVAYWHANEIDGIGQIEGGMSSEDFVDIKRQILKYEELDRMSIQMDIPMRFNHLVAQLQSDLEKNKMGSYRPVSDK